MVKRTEGENGEILAPPMRQIKIRFSQRQRERESMRREKKKILGEDEEEARV